MQNLEKPLEPDGSLLDESAANILISRFRNLYHRGEPAKYGENILNNVENFLGEEQDIKSIPQDILGLRLATFNDPMLRMSAKVGTLPSYLYFPSNTIEVTKKHIESQRIFSVKTCLSICWFTRRENLCDYTTPSEDFLRFAP